MLRKEECPCNYKDTCLHKRICKFALCTHYSAKKNTQLQILHFQISNAKILQNDIPILPSPCTSMKDLSSSCIGAQQWMVLGYMLESYIPHNFQSYMFYTTMQLVDAIVISCLMTLGNTSYNSEFFGTNETWFQESYS
jgi:hypothetical protein